MSDTDSDLMFDLIDLIYDMTSLNGHETPLMSLSHHR